MAGDMKEGKRRTLRLDTKRSKEDKDMANEKGPRGRQPDEVSSRFSSTKHSLEPQHDYTAMAMAFSPSSSSHSTLHSTFLRPLPKPCNPPPPPSSISSPSCIHCSAFNSADVGVHHHPITRRGSVSTLLLGGFAMALPTPDARADIEDEYKKETQEVIERIRSTLGLDKADPGRGDAVKALRETSNQWVAKYRREKRFAGKPSYSNIYSVLNAVSGHYISYGDGAPLPAKRKTLILDEVETAERSLNRGR